MNRTLPPVPSPTYQSGRLTSMTSPTTTTPAAAVPTQAGGRVAGSQRRPASTPTVQTAISSTPR